MSVNAMSVREDEIYFPYMRKMAGTLFIGGAGSFFHSAAVCAAMNSCSVVIPAAMHIFVSGRQV